jgi:flagellar hook-associated protein 2
LRPDGRGIRITDISGGTDPLTVNALGGSKAARDLGLENASGTGTVDSTNVRASLGSVLLRNLAGGSGITTGRLALTDRAGNYVEVDAAGANSLSDLISRINTAGNGVRAAVNRAGTGLEITDVSGGTGNLSISSLSGPNIAGLLGIAGDFDTSVTSVDGGSLKRQFISENSRLASLNGGKGISSGTFRITNSNGVTADVSLTGLTDPKLSDVIERINATNIGVIASINAEGSGLLLTDTLGGPAKLNVTDRSGSAASDLRISGTATANTLDGAYAKDITVEATDTLNSLITKINATNLGVSASLINDGNGANPFRLALNASNSGEDGRFTFDTGATGIRLDTLVRGQNAAVFLGSSSATNPVLITSSSNTLSNVLPGVTLNLNSASSGPVTVNVTRSSETAVATIKSFVQTTNALTSRLQELTKFDTATNVRGVLLGDSTASSITSTLFAALQAPVQGTGRYTLLSQIGITVGEKNQLSFDEEKFKSAYNTDPESVQRLFTAFNNNATTTITRPDGTQLSQTTTVTPFGTDAVGVNVTTDGSGNRVRREVKLEGFGFGYTLQKALNRLVDPVSGLVVQQNKTLDEANEVFQDRITSLTAQLDAKRLRLQRQFAQMEQVLSQLQSQQSAIGRISSVAAPAQST